MFKGNSGSGDLNGFLDAGSHIQGELHFEDTFRVDGRVTGKVFSSGDLVVGERGEVDGEIQVARVYISGTVRGAIRGAQRVELTAGAKVKADLETMSLVIEEGAFYEGRCGMTSAGGKKGSGVEERPAVVHQMPIPKEG